MYINPNSIPCQYMQGFYVHPDYPGYSVDCNGNVFSYHSKKLLNCSISLFGYKHFTYCNGPIFRKNIFVHRLVAFHFVPLPIEFNGDYSLATVDHVDSNKLNNRYTNLEWVTLEENVKRAWRNGLCDSQLRPIFVLDKVTKDKYVFPSITEASKSLKVNEKSIYNYLSEGRKGYVYDRYICGYQDDESFVTKLNDINAMLRVADDNTKVTRPINVIDKITKEIYKFSNAAEAERQLSLVPGSICSSLNREDITYIKDRYICGYQDDEVFTAKLTNIDDLIREAEFNTRNITRSVVVVDKVDKYIYIFSSVKEAAATLGVDVQGVYTILSSNRIGYVANRYIVGYIDNGDFTERLTNIDSLIEEADSKTKAAVRPVICRDVLYNTYTEYPSIAECSRQIGQNKKTIFNHIVRKSRSPIHGRYAISYKN